MNDNHRRTYEKFVRARDFGEGHAADFVAASLGHQLFLDIGTVVAEFNRLAAAEASSHSDARQGTDIRALTRLALRERMEAIIRTARVLSNEVPGIEDKFACRAAATTATC